MRTLLLSVLVLLPSLCWARTVAILPLEKGAGSDTYEGLGVALAGMLVSDLAQVDGLELVERQRLDAVLSEIELSKQGYLDPATAQKAGKGVGAELVLTGSWSVVGSTFALDARLVAVEKAGVVKAAAVQGSIDDFVSVEKELVEDLLTKLDVAMTTAVRRKVLSAVQTESFDAFSAYGKGLKAEQDGDLEQATDAYREAVTADSGFTQAATALAAAKERLAALQQGQESAESAETARGDAVLFARFPPEITRSAKHRDSDEELAGFALRMSVLYRSGRYCQKYEEMWHFWERRGDPSMPKSITAYPSGLFWKLKEDLDLDIGGWWPKFYDTEADFIGNSDALSSMARLCYDKDPKTYLAQLDRILARAVANGVADDTPDDAVGESVRELLEHSWLRAYALNLGIDATWQARMESVLGRYEEGSRKRKSWLIKMDNLIKRVERQKR